MDIKESLHIFKRNIQKTIDYHLPDKIYLKKKYKEKLGKELNLKNPRTYNEKLNWLKLYDRNPEYTKMVDKYEVRELIKNKIGEKYLIPLLGVWLNVDTIDFNQLPNEFVLKCNHNNGVIVCRDKKHFDFEEARNNLRCYIEQDFYRSGREWAYKNVKRKIIAEKFMNDGGEALTDYKFFCFDGEVKALYVSTTVDGVLYLDYFDTDFIHLNIEREDHPNVNADKNVFIKPDNFDDMIRIAEILSKGIPHVRVDLYSIACCVCFGEMTFYTSGGFAELYPEKWNYTLGNWIQLPKKHKQMEC